MNTTIYNLIVTVDNVDFPVTIRIADNGVWDIDGSAALIAKIGKDHFTEWSLDFWAERNRSVRTGQEIRSWDHSLPFSASA